MTKKLSKLVLIILLTVPNSSIVFAQTEVDFYPTQTGDGSESVVGGTGGAESGTIYNNASGASTAENKFDYVLLEPLPGFSSDTVRSTEFASFAQQVINLIIGLSAVISVLAFTWGGFQYLTGDSLQMKADGKKNMSNAVVGLLLILCAYLILYTINPQLLNLNLNIPSADTSSRNTSVGGGGATPLPVPGSREAAPFSSVTRSSACANCYNVTVQGVGTCTDCMRLDGFFALKTDGLGTCSTQRTTGCYVDRELGEALFSLQTETGRSLSITEAWPPTVTHRNQCHIQTTCVDVGVNVPASRRNQYIETVLTSSSVRSQYEGTNLADVQNVCGLNGASCAPDYSCGAAYSVCYNPNATGPHFSIYKR